MLGCLEHKKRKLEDGFIKTFTIEYIQETLRIDIEEAVIKVRNYDFTIKNIINSFKGYAPVFISSLNMSEILNTYGEIYN